MKTIKLIKGLHITTTEKKSILQMIENGFTQAWNRPKTKVYTILQGTPIGDGYIYKISIDSKMNGATDRTTVEVKVTP